MIRLISFFLISILLISPALAAGDRVFSLTVDNDVLTPTDRYFTNGVRLTAAFGEGSQSAWMDRFMDRFFFLPKTYQNRVIHFGGGQNMYTPEDKSTFALVSDDRPYAGWLYGEMGIEVVTDKAIDYFTVQVGVIGPISLAGRTQRSYHRLISSPRPNGWPNQLGNEPAFVVAYQKAFRNDIPLGNSGWLLTSDPHFGAALGTVYTYGALGWTVRIGRGFKGENGPPPGISPALPGSRYFKTSGDFAWYLFAAVEGRAVARNIFLDGNTFAASHSVDKKHIVGDFRFGLVVIIEGIRLSYSHVFQTREFTLQDGKHEYSSVEIAFRF